MNDVNRYMHAAGYESLADVLKAAFDQAASGKGAERHANGRPFDEQPMQVISDLLGTDAGMAFQAIKKLIEGRGFPEIERREREMLGAINYIAGMVIYGRRHHTEGTEGTEGTGGVDWRVIAEMHPLKNTCVEVPIERAPARSAIPTDAEMSYLRLQDLVRQVVEYDVAAMDARAKQALISMGWTPPSEGPLDLGEFVPPKARAMQAAVEGFAEAVRQESPGSEVALPTQTPTLPIIRSSELPAWVPTDAEWFAHDAGGDGGCGSAYREINGTIYMRSHWHPHPHWRPATPWPTAAMLQRFRAGLHRIVDDAVPPSGKQP